MLLETTTVEGWVEKLAGTRIQRWQKRWLVVGEQSVDWYEERPKPGAKPKIRGTRAIQQNDELSVVSVITTFDPRQFPKTTDPKFHYFAVNYRNPEQQTLYRVATADDKQRFVGFFSRLLKRWEQHGGASRDPVFWKQWADSVLTSTHDVADEARTREDLFDEEERESAALRHAIQKTRDERPPLLSRNATLLDRVAALKAELRSLDELKLRHQKTAEAAEAKVQAEESRLTDLVQECSEEVRHHKFLEQRAEQQRAEAAQDIQNLEREIEAAVASKQQAFAKWRRLEEHHVDKQRAAKGSREFAFSLEL